MKKILLIEDDSAIREALSKIIEVFGYPLSMAANGKEGLDYLNANEAPCMILLDLMMPVMTGWEFMEIFSKSNRFEGIPVIVISAYTNKPLPEGIAGFLSKPIDLDTLLAKIMENCKG